MTPDEIERLRAIDRAVRGEERDALFYDLLAWIDRMLAEDDEMDEDGELDIADWIDAQQQGAE